MKNKHIEKQFFDFIDKQNRWKPGNYSQSNEANSYYQTAAFWDYPYKLQADTWTDKKQELLWKGAPCHKLGNTYEVNKYCSVRQTW